jgi:GR25 family glycosyltransferase involved in LPS biosynthesis
VQGAVINLDRQPERLAAFRQWNDGCGLTIERFSAVDSETLDPPAKPSDNVEQTYVPSACALSHRRLWERAAMTTQPMAVFEDDAVIRSDAGIALHGLMLKMRKLPRWDLLLLGFNTDTVLSLRPGQHVTQLFEATASPSVDELWRFRSSRMPTHPFRLATAFGLCGYVISAGGARRLLKLCFPTGGRVFRLFGPSIEGVTLDHLMNGLYRMLDAFVCIPPLVMTPNLKGGAVLFPPSASSGSLMRKPTETSVSRFPTPGLG